MCFPAFPTYNNFIMDAVASGKKEPLSTHFVGTHTSSMQMHARTQHVITEVHSLNSRITSVLTPSALTQQRLDQPTQRKQAKEQGPSRKRLRPNSSALREADAYGMQGAEDTACMSTLSALEDSDVDTEDAADEEDEADARMNGGENNLNASCDTRPQVQSSAQVMHEALQKLGRAEVRSMISSACDLVSEMLSLTGNISSACPDGNTMLEGLLPAKSSLQKSLELLYYLDQAMSTAQITTQLLRQLVRPDTESEDSLGQSRDTDVELAAGVARFTGLGDNDEEAGNLNRVQQLMLYMLNITHSRGYRRMGEDCYEKLYTPHGMDTLSWKRAISIKGLVYEVTRKELNFKQWINLTHGKSNASTVTEYLMNCVDSQFPELIKDRHIFSFRNGVYITCTQAVQAYSHAHRGSASSEEALKDIQARRMTDIFVPYENQQKGGEDEGQDQRTRSAAAAVLVPGTAACKYFDSDFPEHLYAATSTGDEADWRQIPTPNLEMIMDYQGFETDVKDWMYALIGRLMYALNETDSWQVMPYLKGQASSGKSTILCDVCKNLYEFVDIGVLSNNMERKFGIGALADKYLFIAPEIKSDLQLEQAEFQSMVSGETVQAAVKFKQAKPGEWRVPGIMAGNEVPGWVDNAGSIGRRIIVFEFLRKVVEGDTDLGKKLNQEMPFIILKCNRAYHQAVARVGKDNVWCHLPEYFKRMKAELTESTNPLHHFMNTGRLQYSPDAYMPLDTLKRAFREHCEENNFKQMKLTKDKYEPIMMEKGLRLDKSMSTRLYPRGPHGRMEEAKEWCIGVDILENRHNNNHQFDAGCAGGGSGDMMNVFD